jgi:hypothetical protein
VGILAALAIGYFIGAKTGSKDLDQLTKSLKALAESDEFADVVAALRSHAGHTLRNLGDKIDGGGDPHVVSADAGDLVDTVRSLFGRDQAR